MSPSKKKLLLEVFSHSVVLIDNNSQFKILKFMQDLSKLAASVAKIKSVDESAKELIDGFAERLKAAAPDPAALQSLIDELDSTSSALAASVAAGTPAASDAPVVDPAPAAPVVDTPVVDAPVADPAPINDFPTPVDVPVDQAPTTDAPVSSDAPTSVTSDGTTTGSIPLVPTPGA